MRRVPLALCLSFAALAAAVPVLVRAGDAPAEPPKPPTTPLPKFQNPLFDAEVGETCFFSVRMPDEKEPNRYYEERVLARRAKHVLVEVVVANAQGKLFSVDGAQSGWRAVSDEDLSFPADSHMQFLKDKEKEEVLVLGDPPSKAVRTVHRFIQYPDDPSKPDGATKIGEIWYSHDVPVTGWAKRTPTMFNPRKEGERVSISWSKRLTPEECAKLAAKWASSDPEKKPDDAGMEEPGMGMDDPSMG